MYTFFHVFLQLFVRKLKLKLICPCKYWVCGGLNLLNFLKILSRAPQLRLSRGLIAFCNQPCTSKLKLLGRGLAPYEQTKIHALGSKLPKHVFLFVRTTYCFRANSHPERSEGSFFKILRFAQNDNIVRSER